MGTPITATPTLLHPRGYTCVSQNGGAFKQVNITQKYKTTEFYNEFY